MTSVSTTDLNSNRLYGEMLKRQPAASCFVSLTWIDGDEKSCVSQGRFDALNTYSRHLCVNAPVELLTVAKEIVMLSNVDEMRMLSTKGDNIPGAFGASLNTFAEGAFALAFWKDAFKRKCHGWKRDVPSAYATIDGSMNELRLRELLQQQSLLLYI